MKHTNLVHNGGRRALSVLSASLLVAALGVPAFGQAPQYPQQYPAQAAPANVPLQQAPQQQAAQPLMPPQQLDDLVAPIALYPDPLLGQVLAATTYPLEVVEAEQWLQQNGNLRGQDLMNAARQQNWDPSVQALVAFPDVLTLLNRDVQWMTDLGNAFLAQQQDVMAAVQRMRVRAQSNGRLSSNAQETVSNQTQDGQNAVVIEPANPNYVYVPEYNPEYVWGEPDWGYYPPLWYPPVTFGFGFYPGIYLGGFFPGWGVGWGGWGLGWGWGCGWGGGGLFVNAGFFSHWGFHGYFGSGYAGGFGARGFGGGGFGAGRVGWQHDPYHRAGVPYGNRGVAGRFGGSQRFAQGRTARANTFGGARGNSLAGARGGFNGTRGGFNGGTATAGARGLAQNRGGFGGSASAASRGFAGRNGGAQSFRGNGGGAGVNSAARGYAGSRYGGNSRPYSGAGYSAQRSSGGVGGGGARSFSGSRYSGGGARSFGGGGGARSFGGGGGARSFGGGGGARSSGGGGGARSFGGGGGGHSFGGGGGGHSSGGGGGHGGGRR